jgi:hypothetical protein
MDVFGLFKSSPESKEENNSLAKYPIYKFVELTNDGNPVPKRIVVFHGKRKQPPHSEIFSDTELTSIRTYSPEIRYSKQFIHKDDTIQTIKKKLVMELDALSTSLQEIYLFSYIRDKLHIVQFFQEMYKTNSFQFTHQMLGQLLFNLKVSPEIASTIPIKESYTLEDVERYFNFTDYNICCSIGQKFAAFRDLLFSANPYDILPNPSSNRTVVPIFKQTIHNSIQTFENHLLLNYGELVNGTIYFSLAGDIIQYSIQNRLDVGYMISLYYPLLENQKILGRSAFLDNHQKLISETDGLLTEQLRNQFESVDIFHEIYYNKTGELPSLNRGITSFHVILHPENKTILPLDAIFKNIHATKYYPFIKYNPGPKRENIFRLYSEKISKSGKKIPFLKKPQITNLSKITGKIKQISVYNQSILDGEPVEIFIDFDANGNISVRCKLDTPIKEDDVLRILLGPVNRFVETLNQYLSQSGYQVNMFHSLRDELVEIANLTYAFEMAYNKDFSLLKYKCLSNVFDIIDDNLRKGAVLRFKRVENFRKMDAIDATITELYKTTNDLTIILNTLMANYDMTKEQALLQFQEYLNQYTRTKGKFVNKSIDIAENPGFPTILRVIPFEQRITVEIDKISGIDYIAIIELYLESFLRMTQVPDSIKLPIQKVKAICLRDSGEDKDVARPIMITTTKTMTEGVDSFADEDDDSDSGSDSGSDGDDEGLMPIYESDGDEIDLEEAVNNAEEEEEDEEKDKKEELPVAAVDTTYSDDESVDSLDVDDLEGQQQEQQEQQQDSSQESTDGMAPINELSEEQQDSSQESTDGMAPINELSEEQQDSSKESTDGMAPINELSEEQQDSSKESTDGMAPINELSEEQQDSSKESTDGMAPINELSEEQQDSSQEFSNGMAPINESSEEESPEQRPQNAVGGTKLFVNKLKRLEPNLILTRKEGQYDTYSRVCPANVSRQPVIITDDEKRKIDETHKDAYGYALRYGSDPNKKNWYICPRYWCTTTNMPLTEEEVKAGKCADGLHEFTSKNHKDKEGNYIQHGPGFLPKDAHPTSCLPCCFKNVASQQQVSRREQCNIQGDSFMGPEQLASDGADVAAVEEPVKAKKAKAKTNVKMDDTPQYYIVSFDTFPIRKSRWGFLPPSMQLFLQVDYSNAITKKNAALIKPNTEVFLRYGVEQSIHQSFIGSIADIFASLNRYREQQRPTPTIQEMRAIISDALTLDTYLKVHNGSLVSVFQPKRTPIEPAVINKHMQSIFYQTLDKSAESQMDFFEDTVASFENFLAFLRDDDAWIDHTYLWDIISMPNPKLFTGGLNLVIMEVTENDITDNVQLICPSNSYSESSYDPRKETLLLMKKDEYYEPIYLYNIKSDEDVEGGSKVETSIKTFSEQLKQTKHVLMNIRQVTQRFCAARPSMPNVYTFKKNISAIELLRILKTAEFVILNQCVNYRSKVIGINIVIKKRPLFLPCFPSSTLTDIPISYMDDVQWSGYEWTRDTLRRVSNSTSKKILCAPMLKVVEENMIIGLLTETNQFVQVDPPIANDIEDGLPEYNSNSYADNGYIEADKAMAVGRNPDITRTTAIRNIMLESQFYAAFRSILRILLNDFKYTEARKVLLNVLGDRSLLYKIKLKKVQFVLEFLMDKQVMFDQIDPELLSELDDISVCGSGGSGSCSDKKYCIMKDDVCTLIIPQTNLVSGQDNRSLYYARLADEFLRYTRIRLFLLEPNKYLNISNTEFKISETELVILQSILEGDYLDNLVPFQMNPYVKQITYDLANPSVSQKYDLNISLAQQRTANEEQTNLDSFIAECIKERLPTLIGNADSMWKRVFPANAKEVVFNNSPMCTFYVFISIFQQKLNTVISVQTVKGALWKKYSEYMGEHGENILNVLSLQGKKEMIMAVKRNQITMEELIMSSEYYLSNLDLWMLAAFFQLPIMLFSSKPLRNLLLSVNWVILGGNRNSDRYFCVRSPSDYLGLPLYHLVEPAYLLRDLKGFDTMINNVSYAENNLSLDTYLTTHNFQMRKLNIKPAL